jgi:hypothetical protein
MSLLCLQAIFDSFIHDCYAIVVGHYLYFGPPFRWSVVEASIAPITFGNVGPIVTGWALGQVIIYDDTLAIVSHFVTASVVVAK